MAGESVQYQSNNLEGSYTLLSLFDFDRKKKMDVKFPLPEQFNESTNWDWKTIDQGMIMGILGQVWNGNAGSLLDTLTGSGSALASSLAGDKIRAASRSLKATNPFQTVYFDGMSLREYQFSFNIASKSEDKMKQNIIQLGAVTRMLSPSLGEGDATFTTPCIGEISFVDDGVRVWSPTLIAVKGLSSDLTPDGAFNTYAKTKAPLHFKISMSFIELELATKNKGRTNNVWYPDWLQEAGVFDGETEANPFFDESETVSDETTPTPPIGPPG